jgi:hypothetical protein
MTISKIKKLGAVLALTLAVAAPVMAAMPADAAPIRVETVMRGHEHLVPVRYDHRGEIGYRDLHWRELRFHRRHVFERHEMIRHNFER